MTRFATISHSWLLLMLVAGGCGELDPCNAADLQEALDEAGRGETVRMGACRVVASLRVPAGVSLEGAGTATSTLASPPGERAVTLTAGSDTGLRSLTVEANGIVGVRAQGSGSVAITDVAVRATRGVAMALDGVDSATLTNVELSGPITADNADNALFIRVTGHEPGPERRIDCESMGTDCMEGDRRDVACPGCGALTQICNVCGHWVSQTAANGLELLGVGEAVLTNVNIRGFASRGAIVLDRSIDGTTAMPTVMWTGGEIADCIDVGLYVTGNVTMTTDDLTLRDTYNRSGALPSFTGIASNGVDLTTSGLSILGNDSYGIVHLRSVASHSGLVATDNGDAALWVEESTGFELIDATIQNNRFAGVAIADSSNVTIRGGEISATAEKPSSVGMARIVRIGDGVHLTNSITGILLDGVTLQNNERAGIVADLGPTLTPDITFSDVTVAGTGTQLGAVGGMLGGDSLAPAPIMSGWDTGITRDAATMANDMMRTENLDAAVDSPPLPPNELLSPCD